VIGRSARPPRRVGLAYDLDGPSGLWLDLGRRPRGRRRDFLAPRYDQRMRWNRARAKRRAAPLAVRWVLLTVGCTILIGACTAFGTAPPTGGGSADAAPPSSEVSGRLDAGRTVPDAAARLDANGHSYVVVTRDAGLTWSESAAAAEQAGGHLVTIHSAVEDDFVWALMSDAGAVYRSGDIYLGPWLGGHQMADAAPTDGWSWISGEPWSFTRWAPQEPNDDDPNDERCLHVYSYLAPRSTWSDGWCEQARIRSYVVEYDE
jgi:hypothetical protein